MPPMAASQLAERAVTAGALIVDDGTPGLSASSSKTADSMTDARGGRVPLQDCRSAKQTGSSRRGSRRGGAMWARRLVATTTPLVFNVAVAAPAFAWPECAC